MSSAKHKSKLAMAKLPLCKSSITNTEFSAVEEVKENLVAEGIVQTVGVSSIEELSKNMVFMEE